MIERPDSPWYPTLRLFRQRERNKWGTVFEKMAAGSLTSKFDDRTNPLDKSVMRMSETRGFVPKTPMAAQLFGNSETPSSWLETARLVSKSRRGTRPPDRMPENEPGSTGQLRPAQDKGQGRSRAYGVSPR